jgi:hypothetical protein
MDLEEIIRQALKDALRAGFKHTGQTVRAVQAVQLARPDMTPADAMAAVKLVQQESPPVSTPTAPPTFS